MTRHVPFLTICLAVCLLVLNAAPDVWAQGSPDDPPPAELPPDDPPPEDPPEPPVPPEDALIELPDPPPDPPDDPPPAEIPDPPPDDPPPVLPPNLPPVLDPVGSQTVDEGQILMVTITASNPDGVAPVLAASGLPEFAALLDNGDGTGTLTLSPSYTHAGTYTNGVITASDGSLQTASETITIVVNDVDGPPMAMDWPFETDEDVVLDEQVPAGDPEGEEVTVLLVGDPSNGQVTLSPDGTFTYTPDADFNGQDAFTFKATCGEQESDVATATITVNPVNDPPVLAVNAGLTLDEGTTGIIAAGLLQTTDPDGDPITYTAGAVPASGTLSKDGAALESGGTFTQADIDAGKLAYTHNGGETAADSFTFTVSDGEVPLEEATFVITVNPVNDPPVANAQSVETDEDVSVGITLTGNDPDENPLTYTVGTGPSHGTLSGTAPDLIYTPSQDWYGEDSFTFKANDGTVDSAPATVSITVNPVNDPPVADAESVMMDEDVSMGITLTGSDPDAEDVLSYSVVAGPSHGTLEGIAPDLIYTPALNYNGEDSFTFKVNDETVDSTPATVTITVNPVNDPPVAVDDTDSTPEDTPVTVDVLANDSDVDAGDALTVASVGSAGNGTITNNGTTVTYSHNPDYNGSDSFTYTVSDGNGGSATATVSITVTSINDPPVAVDDAATTDEDVAVDINVVANDTDVEDDPLTVTSVTQGTIGAVAINPDGTLKYTPALSLNGDDSFTYTISDGNGGNATATVSITVTPVNDPPVALAGDDQEINEGDEVSFKGTYSDPDLPDDTHTIGWNFGDDGTAAGTLEPTHLYADDDEDDAYTVTLTVTDAKGAAGTDDLIVTVHNVAPTVNAGPDATINKGSAFIRSGSLTDPGADEWEATVDYGDDSGVQPLTLSGKSFSLSHTYANDGAYTVIVTVTDDDEGVDADTVQVTVDTIEATVDFDPDTFNLTSGGQWVTVYIELPDGYDVANIVNTPESPVMLNGAVLAETDPKYGFVTSEDGYIMDHDGDGIPERMVKFDRDAVGEILGIGDDVSVTVTGVVQYDNGQDTDGADFEASDLIRVIDKGKKGKGKSKKSIIPEDYALLQNAPNPFNPETAIEYGLPEEARVRLVIYNSMGQKVGTVVDAFQSAGYHQIVWDGRDSQGRPVSGGVYFYRLTAGEFAQSRRMTVLK